MNSAPCDIRPYQYIGSTILSALLNDARSRGIRRVSLETGAADFFHPARHLYLAAGFVECDPFGSYRDDPHSVFLSRSLC